MIEYAKAPNYNWFTIFPWVEGNDIDFRRRGKIRIQGEVYYEWSPAFQDHFDAEREREKTWEALNDYS